MQVVLNKIRWEVNELIERMGRKWMVLLLGLGEEATQRMTEAVKAFLERMYIYMICQA